jgi:endonuclease G
MARLRWRRCPTPCDGMARSFPWIVAAVFLVSVAILVMALSFLGHDAPATSKATSSSAVHPQAPQIAVDVAPPGADGSITEHNGEQRLSLHPISVHDQLQEIRYTHFLVGYDNRRRNPAWVMYHLDGPIVNGGHQARRPQQFAVEMATQARVRDHDYSRSGYDRGHMCPSYAMFSRFGAQGEDETFIMSNVIPQVHSLNAGLWEDLEEHQAGRAGKQEGWATATRFLTIINGPVYSGQPHFTAMQVEVPDACFSIVFAYRSDHGDYQAMAFEMPNRNGVKGPLDRYLVSIHDIENQTGLDFFSGPAAGLRQPLEDMVAPGLWH